MFGDEQIPVSVRQELRSEDCETDFLFRMTYPSMFLATVLSLAFFAAPDTPLYESEFLFPPEDFHDHSSSFVKTAEGDLIACGVSSPKSALSLQIQRHQAPYAGDQSSRRQSKSSPQRWLHSVRQPRSCSRACDPTPARVSRRKRLRGRTARLYRDSALG